MDEGRILDKLDSIEARGVETLVAVSRLEEQMKDVPDLKDRVAALERWRWTATGALVAAGSSLVAQVYSAMKGA